jgi:hypothetical protein
MGDDANGKSLPPPGFRTSWRREREQSGIEPFFQLRFRRRGRSISRIVVKAPEAGKGPALPLEIFFALG